LAQQTNIASGSHSAFFGMLGDEHSARVIGEDDGVSIVSGAGRHNIAGGACGLSGMVEVASAIGRSTGCAGCVSGIIAGISAIGTLTVSDMPVGVSNRAV
jgi:hypothetical protein